MEVKFPIPSTLDTQELLLTFYACAEESDDGFLFVDPNGRIAYINEAYCNYIDIKRENVLGQLVLDVIDTSKMVEVASDPLFPSQRGVLHRVSARQYRDGEHYVIVNRSNVSVEGTPIAGVGQVKFVRSTLKLSAAINHVYDELSYYKDELKRLSMDRYSFESIIGESSPIKAAKKIAMAAAHNDFPVLVTGETGTGKEVFSNAIHYAGVRKTKPFIRINCASIPATLLESELFGYVEGAFTGARKGGRKGKFELANGGTLFLDEIGDMPLSMQAKILRALQEKEVEPVGGERSISVDVRIIAATNKDLEQEMRAKRFRADLFYRLNVIPLILPPLRHRIDDIKFYTSSFLRELNSKYHTETVITPEASRLLEQYSWPGNVRELKNIVERCYVLQEKGTITSHVISASMSALRLQFSDITASGKTLDKIMEEYEREVLLSAIRSSGGNLRKTAETLGIHRVTLYKKLDKLGVHREDFGAVYETNEKSR